MAPGCHKVCLLMFPPNPEPLHTHTHTLSLSLPPTFSPSLPLSLCLQSRISQFLCSPVHLPLLAFFRLLWLPLLELIIFTFISLCSELIREYCSFFFNFNRSMIRSQVHYCHILLSKVREWTEPPSDRRGEAAWWWCSCGRTQIRRRERW